jgi:serine/threonine protein kinase
VEPEHSEGRASQVILIQSFYHPLYTFVNIKYNMSDSKRNVPGKPPSNDTIGTDKTVQRLGPPLANKLPLTEDGHVSDGTSLSVRKNDPLIGAVFDGKYTIEERLGEGGMAVVYKARFLEVWNGQTVIDKPVAIKLMNPMRKSSDADESEARKQEDDWGINHFIREVKIATTLEHENIVRVMGFIVTEDDRPGCVMELIKGSDLHGVIYDDEHPMRIDKFVNLASQICSGLQYAHEKGIIHRDIKPANILVTGRENLEVAKVNDFGLARNRNASSHMTKAGDIFGTFEYAPPEQIKGETHDDARMDIYALGATMYEMLCKRPPFTQESIIELQRAIVFDAPQEPGSIREAIPQELSHIIMRCLEKDPEQRFQTMKELKDALERFRKKAQIAPTRRINPADMEAISAKRKPPTPKKAETMKAPDEAIADTGEDTTMAMSVKPPQSGGRRRLAIGAVAAALAVSALVAGLTRRLDADPARRQTAQSDAETKTDDSPGTDPGPPALVPLTRLKHRFIFRTEPDGVEVEADGQECVTQKGKGCTIELDEGSAPVDVTLRKTGFTKLARTIVPDSDKEIELAMKPLKEPVKAAAQKPAPLHETKKDAAPEIKAEKKPAEKKPSITTEE